MPAWWGSRPTESCAFPAALSGEPCDLARRVGLSGEDPAPAESGETVMETTVATAAPFPLRDVEDLHDADLERVLADELRDAGDGTASATGLADVIRRPGRAVFARTFCGPALQPSAD